MVETDIGACSKAKYIERRGAEKKLVVRYGYAGSGICGDNVLSRRVRVSLPQKMIVLLRPQVENALMSRMEHSIVHNVHGLLSA